MGPVRFLLSESRPNQNVRIFYDSLTCRRLCQQNVLSPTMHHLSTIHTSQLTVILHMTILLRQTGHWTWFDLVGHVFSLR